MGRQSRAWARRACVLALLSVAVAKSPLVQAQDADERIRKLEERLQAVTEELRSLKQQLRMEREAQHGSPTQAQGGDGAGTDGGQQTQAKAAAQAKDRATVVEHRPQSDGLVRSAEGIGFEDAQGRWAAHFNGRIQGDYRHFEPDGILADTFAIRRARLGLQVNILNDYLFRLDGEYASGNAQTTTQTVAVTNAYLQADWFKPYARIRFGQSKPQFGLENTMSANFTDFQERGLPQNLIQTLNYDRGVMVDGTPFAGFNYGVAITNGTGLNTEERQGSAAEIKADGKMLTVRLTENFAELIGVPGAVLHVGGDYKEGTAVNSPSNPFTAATGQTEARGLTFFTPQAFNAMTGVTASNVDRKIDAYELALAYGPLKLQGESWTAKYRGTRSAPAPSVDYDLDVKAYYLNLMWLVTGETYAESYRDGQFGRIRPRNNFDRGERNWGAWELGVRYGMFDATDFSATAPANAGRLAPNQTAPVTTGTNKAKAWTAGLKWWPNPFTRLMLDYVRTEFDTPVTAAGVTVTGEDAVTFRAQLDF